MSETRPLATFDRPSDVSSSHAPRKRGPKDITIFEFGINLTGGADGQHSRIAKDLVGRLRRSGRLRAAYGLHLAKSGSVAGTILGRASESQAWAHVPARTDGADRAEVVKLLHDELIDLGARPRTMALLSWEVAAVDPMVTAIRVFGRTTSISVEQRVEAVLEAIRPHVMERLLDDHQAGAVRYPELVRELHMDLSTLEFLIVREMLESPNRRGEQKSLGQLFALHESGRYDEATSIGLVEGLAAKDWLDAPVAGQDHLGRPTIFIARGPKARRLTTGDVVPTVIS